MSVNHQSQNVILFLIELILAHILWMGITLQRYAKKIATHSIWQFLAYVLNASIICVQCAEPDELQNWINIQWKSIWHQCKVGNKQFFAQWRENREVELNFKCDIWTEIGLHTCDIHATNVNYLMLRIIILPLAASFPFIRIFFYQSLVPTDDQSLFKR